MTALAASAAAGYSAAAPSLARLERGLMWLIGFSGGFVIIEPAPYEFLIALSGLIFFATGLTLRAAHLPLVLLLIIYVSGYLIGVVPVLDAEGTTVWTAVSCFMSVTTLFFALAMCGDTERRLDLLMKGYLAIAVVVSIFGIITYFHLLPGSDAFMFAQRSKSTFKDPNVLGAFLVLPTVLAVQGMMTGRLRDFVVGGAIAVVLAVELLLAFSRGAWGAFGAAAVVMVFFTWVTGASARERLRIVTFAAAGCGALAVLIAIILSLPQVHGLFEERASLVQSYDSGRFGRFGRHILGAEMSLDNPFGIGPLQFSKFFPEDPHNSFLDSFMAGGWLSGAAYFALIVVTLAIGLRFVFVATPWRHTYIALYASFVALTGESYIIDVQHWRHYFLLMGVLWGLVVAAAARSGPYPQRLSTAEVPGGTPNRRSKSAVSTTLFRASPGENRPWLRSRTSVTIVRDRSERSAARLAHQSGGLGVPSSNLGAPTNNYLK